MKLFLKRDGTVSKGRVAEGTLLLLQLGIDRFADQTQAVELAENVLAVGSLWQEPAGPASDTGQDSFEEPHHCRPHPQETA